MQQQAISSDLIRGHIDTIILHTLIDGDKFAQQISDAIESKSQSAYKINQATLYSSLKRLEGLKYVKSYWNDSVDGGRRKYFNLTQIGKETVENNLSNWSYSRSIIDKLMDCQPQVVYKTQVIEKIVEKQVEIPSQVQNSEGSTPLVLEKTQNKDLENVDVNSQKQINEQTESQDINFRNILNGLIKTSLVQNQKPVAEHQDLQPIIKETEPLISQEKPIKKQGFNETITNTSYATSNNSNEKIDFGDLVLKSIKEGYKLRISSKDSCKINGNLLINKLNFITQSAMFVIALISLFILSFVVAKNAFWANYLITLGTIVLAISPIISLLKYAKNPKHTIAKHVSNDLILTSFIIVFNLSLITLALNLIFNVNFDDLNLITITFITPITLFVEYIIYNVVYVFCSKSKTFKINLKK